MLFGKKRSVVAGLVVAACLAATHPAMGHTSQKNEAGMTAAVDTTQRPVLLTTEAEIVRAQARSTDASSPFYASWVLVQNQANQGLARDFMPHESDDIRIWTEDAGLEARLIHALAVAYRVNGNTAYLTKARDALMEWAVFCNADLPPDDPTPSWQDFHYPGKAMAHAAGLHIGRRLVVFADAYAILQPYLTTAERTEIERWFASMRSPIQHSTHLWETATEVKTSPTAEPTPVTPPWLNRQYYNNHLTAHVVGQLAIGYATGNANLVSYALSDPDNPRDLHEVFGGVLVMPGQQLQERDPSLNADDDRWPDPLRSETYDRYRATSRTAPDGPDRGLIYSSLGQKFVAVAAELARNNNAPTNYWRHIPDSGESLRDSFATYAPFISAPVNPERDLTDAVACRGRYYENSAFTQNIKANWLAATEVAFREYPYDPAIREVIRSEPVRSYNDTETFGATSPLLNGELLDPPGGPTVTYQASTGSTPTAPVALAANADSHFLGDWDGDGDDTPGWRRGLTFYLSNSASGANPQSYDYGRACSEAIVGDWDGDGDDTIGIRMGKTFLLSNDNTGPADVVYTGGRASDRLVIGDWNGNGIDAPGLIRGTEMFLRTNNNTDPTYLPSFTFGRTGDRFVAGDWNGDGIDSLAGVREVGNDLSWSIKSGNSAADPVASPVTHGTILDGALAGNVSGGAADELAVIRYR
ncbi:alginate lyase family protein [Jiangella asiatica]|nr:alginate lyase family protein [Jiangella asiatica]